MPADSTGSPRTSTYDVLLVQEAMRVAGLYDGPLDGVAGARTRRAVRRYKRRHGLAVDDRLDATFIEHLRAFA